MNRWTFTAGALASSLLVYGCATAGEPVYTDAQEAEVVTDQAPELVRVDTGEQVALSDFEGQYVALHFLLKTECPLCLRHTNNYHNRQDEADNVVQVFIKPDSIEEIEGWLGDSAGGPVIYQDANAQLAEHFEIPHGYRFHGETVHYPAFVLLDPEGKEVLRYVGENNRDRFGFNQFLEAIAQLNAE